MAKLSLKSEYLLTYLKFIKCNEYVSGFLKKLKEKVL